MNHQHHKGHNRKRFRAGRIILGIILVILIAVGAFAAVKYHNLKSAVNDTYQGAGINKARNASALLQNKSSISILLMGTDTGALGRSYKGRTDTMMLVTVNPRTKQSTITSIPRDTGLRIPDYEDKGPQKINAAYSYGSAATAINSVQELLNVPIDYYALINMGGMEKVVNAVDGIDISPTLSFDYAGYSFEKGQKTHMNGKKALAYARMRYDDPQGDYGRQTRQRAVITAILGKAGSISTLLNQKFLNSLSKQMKTDLTFADLTALAKDYRDARKTVKETHLQGTGKMVDGQAMEIISKKELQRVTNLNRANLGMSREKTGSAALTLSYIAKLNHSSKSISSTTSSTTTSDTTTTTPAY
ncbi:transcriptional regulator [Secundilactobacillus oryzae JCM 18671]|uniref:Transcriptional regulator n=1 Tax=Secundilactobacillus oryzae JCM 18671 TaxID=1291743 RepID=A0A081BIC3_9LACO|nr:LCP family protein [Secundilactobacillus oryzae]GAK47791.1 transcriptional regulator [Secundilactobacillus oryzae JCM 18671]